MRGAAATDDNVPVGRRLVQQSRGDLTPNLVFLGKSIRTCGTHTLYYDVLRDQPVYSEGRGNLFFFSLILLPFFILFPICDPLVDIQSHLHYLSDTPKPSRLTHSLSQFFVSIKLSQYSPSRHSSTSFLQGLLNMDYSALVPLPTPTTITNSQSTPRSPCVHS